MTITITKARLAIGVIAIALVATTTAWASSHPFTDVPPVGDPDERFFSEPVQWAWDNSLTTGSPSGSDTFKPLDGVTRGENITFNYRYDQNVVQPALDAITDDVADNAADIADNAADIAGLPSVYAVRVESDGTLLLGPSGTSSTQSGTGYYKVTFPVDISECIWQVTPTNDVGLFLVDTDQVFAALQQDYSASPFGAIEEGIRVRMKDEDGTAVSNRFDLVVHC